MTKRNMATAGLSIVTSRASQWMTGGLVEITQRRAFETFLPTMSQVSSMKRSFKEVIVMPAGVGNRSRKARNQSLRCYTIAPSPANILPYRSLKTARGWLTGRARRDTKSSAGVRPSGLLKLFRKILCKFSRGRSIVFICMASIAPLLVLFNE